MAFDPITMALCKGEASAGDVALPYVNLTTPIEFGQTIRLSAEESWALHRAYNQYRPAVVFLNLDTVGSVAIPFVFCHGCFTGSIFADRACMIIALIMTDETADGYDIEGNAAQSFYYWKVETSGGTLNPIE